MSSPELLTEAAGVKIFMTPMSEEDPITRIDCSMGEKVCVLLENVKGLKASGKSCGFHLTKSKWDPYSWVSHVDIGSLADISGLRTGDCLVSMNGKDLIGLRVKDIGLLMHQRENEHDVKLCVWRYRDEKEELKLEEEGLALKGPLPNVARKLANAVSGAVRILECPICLESSMPPVSQCVHGHIVCSGCRRKTSRCPVCRVRLGQGRCLLADELHKVFRDNFDLKSDDSRNAESESCCLRDRLFGRNKNQKRLLPVVTNANKSNTVSRARHLLLTKLFLGGLEKAASADNLTAVSEINAGPGVENQTLIKESKFGDRLSLHDRTKSASTGELSRESSKEITGNTLQTTADNSRVSSTTSLLSSCQQTPTWGGSVDSVSCVQVACPLSKLHDCRESVATGMLIEHLNRAHKVPQVHFYSGNVKIPLPLPFGSEAIYMLHYAGDLFFFQNDQEQVWMTCASGGNNNNWEWTLHGQGKEGTEIKLRRNVASLENLSTTLSSQFVAPLPDALSLHTLIVNLIDGRSREKLGM